MKKKTTALIMVCLLAAILCGCGGRHNNFMYRHKADDSISKALSKSVKTKWMQYEGKRVNDAGTVTSYSFHINQEKEGLAEAAATAVNAVLAQEKTQTEICINFTETAPVGVTETLFSLKNYYQDGSMADYGKLQCLCIYGTGLGDSDSIYNAPETYRNFPDIRYLKVSEKIQKAAEDKGIDWYEYWPELEEVEVYYNGSIETAARQVGGVRYEGGSDILGNATCHVLRITAEKEGQAEEIAVACNEVLLKKKTQNRIAVNIAETFSSGNSEILFCLHNYYQKDALLADYEKLQYLEISGTRYGNSDSIYNDPENYKNFPDIRYLKVTEKIQRAAVAKGIDWYEYWPELEVVEVYPDGFIAEALSKSLDVKWMQYWGSTTEGGGRTPTAPPCSFTYTVRISREQKGLAEAAAAAINEALVRGNTQNRVCVVFTETIPAGGTEELFSLQNYYREDASLADCEKLRCLIIRGTEQGDPDSIYNDPETYQNFPDIRYLKVSEKVQKAAEERGIDWYEYWPELEEVEVY